MFQDITRAGDSIREAVACWSRKAVFVELQTCASFADNMGSLLENEGWGFENTEAVQAHRMKGDSATSHQRTVTLVLWAESARQAELITVGIASHHDTVSPLFEVARILSRKRKVPSRDVCDGDRDTAGLTAHIAQPTGLSRLTSSTSPTHSRLVGETCTNTDFNACSPRLFACSISAWNPCINCAATS